ncbi:MAG TPA: DNA polymerase III subunit delta [Streptosporangiaceae bacterium]|jgi:DNA polymerase-3 subunit delta
MASGVRRDGDQPEGDSPGLVTVIVGEEELLVERAVAAAVAAARAAAEAGPDGTAPDVHDVAAAGLTAGELVGLTAPSLFGGGSVVVIRSAEDATASLAEELRKLAGSAAPDISLVLTHSGGVKNKALLADLAAAGARRIDCPAIKRFGDRMDFLRAEFRRAGRKADDGGLRALLDAVGTDLRELAAACSQLAADTTGVVSQSVVARYYHGRAEATGFAVADKACEGNLPAALEQLRWALATGTSPVLVTSALAAGLRTLALVGSAGRGLSSSAQASDLGMPSWKIDKARQQLRGWTSEGLARAHAAVAEADVQVKGEGASAGYALERAITTIVACRNAG